MLFFPGIWESHWSKDSFLYVKSEGLFVLLLVVSFVMGISIANRRGFLCYFSFLWILKMLRKYLLRWSIKILLFSIKPLFINVKLYACFRVLLFCSYLQNSLIKPLLWCESQRNFCMDFFCNFPLIHFWILWIKPFPLRKENWFKMLKEQIAFLLQKYLGNYVEGLSQEALKISAWQGLNHSIHFRESRREGEINYGQGQTIM